MIKLIKEKLGVYFKYGAIIFSILILVSLSRNLLRIQRSGGEVEKAEERVNKLAQQNEELKEKLKEVKSDEFVESQLRNKLNLAKEGEAVIVLPEDEILRKLAPAYEEEEETLPDPNWKKWMKLFL